MKVTIELDTDVPEDMDLLAEILDRRMMATPAPPAPVVRPAPHAPLAPVVPFVVSTSAQLDSAGMPWDGRIHSSSRAFLSDGTWRQRRNTNPFTVAAVTAQLRAALGAPAPSVPPAPVDPALVAAVTAQVRAALGAGAPSVPPAPVAPPD